MNEFLATRRRFLQLGLTALVSAAATPAFAVLPRPAGSRGIAFHNLHTDERLRVTYWCCGVYDRASLAAIDHILRDHHAGAVYPISPRLIDLLFDLRARLQNKNPVEIISGYRAGSTGAHGKGMAVDIRMQGVPLPQIYDAALSMRRGGVGYYSDSEFVHLDVGTVRRG
jgi:uncharacterized protein YcbK (DUF882 family)